MEPFPGNDVMEVMIIIIMIVIIRANDATGNSGPLLNPICYGR